MGEPQGLSRRLVRCATSETESQSDPSALDRALSDFAQRDRPDDLSALEHFVRDHPADMHAPAMHASLADEYLSAGRYSRAIDSYRMAWERLRSAESGAAQALAADVLLELLRLNIAFADSDQLGELLAVAEQLDLPPAQDAVAEARRSLETMRDQPQISYRCGVSALLSLLTADAVTAAGSIDELDQVESSPAGLNLRQVQVAAEQVGVSLTAVRMEADDAEVPAACIVHWKVNHFAAVVGQRAGRYLVEDSALRPDHRVWMTRSELLEETSGYFLVPEPKPGSGWREVEPAEAATVWGRSTSTSNDPHGYSPWDHKLSGGGRGSGGGPCLGMPVWDVHLMVVSLNIVDTPVGYVPPRGLPVQFTLTYNQRDMNPVAPQSIGFSTVGWNWSHSWLSYILDGGPASAYLDWVPPGGGVVTFREDILAPAGTVYRSALLGAVARRVGSGFEIQLIDGQKYRLNQVLENLGNRRQVHLTEMLDPAGTNAIRLSYEALDVDGRQAVRLVSVDDPNGGRTTISYSGDFPLQIAGVVDPFQRTAELAYDDTGRLTAIVDCAKLKSTFEYAGSSAFVSAMTTPYGTTQFQFGEAGRTRWLEITHADGERERVEFSETPGPIMSEDRPAVVPTGMLTNPRSIAKHNTYVWDRMAMRMHPGDFAKATVYHWFLDIGFAATRYLQYVGAPLTYKTWYEYPGQTGAVFTNPGTGGRPAKIGRVQEDGASAVTAMEYSPAHVPTRVVDPCGRVTVLVYDDDRPLDLVRLEQHTSGGVDVLARYSYDALPGLPTAVTDAGGQITTFTHNEFGQVTGMVDAEARSATLEYDDEGFLLAVVQPDGNGAAARTTYTYDVLAGRRTTRVASVTDADGRTTSYTYDALDRVTTTTYADGSTESAHYDRLDLAEYVDPSGVSTRLEYDSQRQLRSIYSAGTTITIAWCVCGCPKTVSRGGRALSHWDYDLQGRLVSRSLANQWPEEFEYERSTGRLAFHRDARNLVAAYRYTPDGLVSRLTYTRGRAGDPVAPGTVSFRYDDDYARLTRTEDQSGATTYAYHAMSPAAAGGAGRVASVHTSGAGAVIAYGYERTGRPVSRTVRDEAGDLISQLTVEYDRLSRIIRKTSELGTLTIDYQGSGTRIATTDHDSGLRVAYEWNGPGSGPDTIAWTYAGDLIVQYGYEYRTDGRIVRRLVKHGNGGPEGIEAFDYDTYTEQLRQAQRGSVTNSYSYDLAGNRQLDRVVTPTTDESLLFFYSAENELGFWDGVPQGMPRDFWRYDEAGNLLNDYRRTYLWDAAGQLESVGYGQPDSQTRWIRDSAGRPVRCQEISPAGTAESRLVWSGAELVAQISADGPVTYFSEGHVTPAGSFLYLRDRLGSVGATVDNTGAVVHAAEYDEWGRPLRFVGDQDPPVGFAGLYRHDRSGLLFGRRRCYEPDFGRWISRDRTPHGLNRYLYADNDPVNMVDPAAQEPTLSEWAGEKLDDARDFVSEHFGYDSDMGQFVRDRVNGYYNKPPGDPGPLRFPPKASLGNLGKGIDLFKDPFGDRAPGNLVGPFINSMYKPWKGSGFPSQPIAIGTFFGRLVNCLMGKVGTALHDV